MLYSKKREFNSTQEQVKMKREMPSIYRRKKFFEAFHEESKSKRRWTSMEFVSIGRFYTKDALSVWTNLGKYFVVRLGYASVV